MNQAIITSRWQAACQSVRSRRLSANDSSLKAKEFVDAEVGRFCQQPCPTTEDDLGIREWQKFVVYRTIDTIINGDKEATKYPTVAQEIYGMLQKLCQPDLPTTIAERDNCYLQVTAVSDMIATITNADVPAKGRPL